MGFIFHKNLAGTDGACFSRSGELLGMITTHFSDHNHPLERELRLTDLYARQAAELIERKNPEDALRASEERFRRYFELGLIGMEMTSPTCRMAIIISW